MPAVRKRDQSAPLSVSVTGATNGSSPDSHPRAGKAFVASLAAALGLHRAWDRAPKVMASAVQPAGTRW